MKENYSLIITNLSANYIRKITLKHTQVGPTLERAIFFLNVFIQMIQSVVNGLLDTNSHKETFLQDFLEILERMVQNL